MLKHTVKISNFTVIFYHTFCQRLVLCLATDVHDGQAFLLSPYSKGRHRGGSPPPLPLNPKFRILPPPSLKSVQGGSKSYLPTVDDLGQIFDLLSAWKLKSRNAPRDLKFNHNVAI